MIPIPPTVTVTVDWVVQVLDLADLATAFPDGTDGAVFGNYGTAIRWVRQNQLEILAARPALPERLEDLAWACYWVRWALSVVQHAPLGSTAIPVTDYPDDPGDATRLALPRLVDVYIWLVQSLRTIEESA
jgi:hypothetical protein